MREFTHRAGSFLSIDNNNYKQWVFRYTFLELEKDLGTKGDITTDSIFTETKVVRAKIIAKEDGVFAGHDEVKYFLKDADAKFRPKIKGDFELNFHFRDGEEFKSGDVLIEIAAELHDLLAVERATLNLLIRMSAIATMTKRMIDLVKDYDDV